jgi:hypothetical protein
MLCPDQPYRSNQGAVIIDSMVTFVGPLTAGAIIEPACIVPFDLAANGYVEEEFLAAGEASGYDLAGEAASDGHWTTVAAEPASYRTRVVVRRPADGRQFSGTVLVEWLNVSSGFESDPDWAFLHEEILRAGHAYVAVSAQALGVMGGLGIINPAGPPAPGLRASDPARYGSLSHPGDRYSFDLFRQIGQAMRDLAPAVSVLGGLRPASVLAIGESQSAIYLTSYINAVQPLTPVFDGFLVHSRGADAASLTGDPIGPASGTVRALIRTDNAAPVLVLEAEGDLFPPLDFWLARQPDGDRFRLWEMAGTSHADRYLVGDAAELLGCDWPINEGPHRFVAQAALHALNAWVTEGTLPPGAARIELESSRLARVARDPAGIAIGGVRTPAVDVPVVTLSGEGPAGRAALGWLFGSTTPLAAGELARRYGDEAGYLRAYTESLDAAIKAGFLLPAHREQLLAEAAAVAFPSAASA